MEKIIQLTETEYNKLVEENKNRYEFHLILWQEYYKGQRDKLVLLHDSSDDSSYITKRVTQHLDDWNNRQDYVEKIYKRNLWDRIFNKRVPYKN